MDLKSPSQNSYLIQFPQKINSKYLRRVLYLNQGHNETVLKKFNMKRIYIRKVIELEPKQVEKPRRPYSLYRDDERPRFQLKDHKESLTKGLLKGLTHLSIKSSSHLSRLQGLKDAKKLIEFQLEPNDQPQVSHLIFYFKRINKYLQKLNFNSSQDCSSLCSHKMKNIYKAIKRLCSLKTLQGKRSPNQMDKALDIEKYIKRLSKLENFECHILDFKQQMLLKNLMDEGKIHPKVTSLSINLCKEFGRALSEIAASGEEELTEIAKTEGTFSLFQFHLFPHLKELDLKAGNPEQYRPTYSSFVGKAFEKLHCLEKLHLDVFCLAEGIEFLFEGLFHLPPLKSFSLETKYADFKVWETLTEFLQKQNQLVWLRCKIGTFGDDEENENEIQIFEDFIASLKNKPHLQYIALETHPWPLVSLANGLEKLTFHDQIKHFELRGTSFSINPQKIKTFLQNFSSFLLRNKNSLYSLILHIPLFEEREYNDSMTKIISQLNQLIILKLNISVTSICDGGTEEFLNQCNDFSSEGDINLWNMNLGRMLSRLEKLQDLTIEFLSDCPDGLPFAYRQWIINTFGVLPSLRNLRNLHFELPDLIEESERINIYKVLEQEMENNSIDCYVNSISIKSHHEWRISESVEAINNQQALKVNLKF